MARPSTTASSKTRDPEARFAAVVAAFAKQPRVTRGGKGFGATGLKVDGKLFALVSSKGRFVAKLPRDRVAALVSAGQAAYFDPGHGRLMKEWVELKGDEGWTALAREAHRFVGGDR